LATRILPNLPDQNTDGHSEPFAGEKHAYTHGGCGYFALALHRITGWPMVVYDPYLETYAHMGVRNPDGAVWDARGRHEALETFIKPFGTMVPENGLRTVTFEELCDDVPGARTWSTIGAERHASMMFPDLPHLPTSDRSSTVAFMDAVEQLSRRHDVWISAGCNAPHLWPVISEDFEGVAGYRVACNGGVTTLDRALHAEMPRGPTHAPRSVERFIRELTSLSTAHRFWIRASLPTAWPRLERLNPTSHQGAHYVIRQSDNAGGFLVNIAR
jgi:hypothetical protein